MRPSPASDVYTRIGSPSSEAGRAIDPLTITVSDVPLYTCIPPNRCNATLCARWLVECDLVHKEELSTFLVKGTNRSQKLHTPSLYARLLVRRGTCARVILDDRHHRRLKYVSHDGEGSFPNARNTNSRNRVDVVSRRSPCRYITHPLATSSSFSLSRRAGPLCADLSSRAFFVIR